MWPLQCVYIVPQYMSFFSLPLLSQDFLPLPCPSWLGGQVVQKLLLLSSPFSPYSHSINISFSSIYPPSARDYWRQLLWGHSLRCKLPSLYSRVPSLVLVLGRHVPAAGDLPGVDYASHQSRAVALTLVLQGEGLVWSPGREPGLWIHNPPEGQLDWRRGRSLHGSSESWQDGGAACGWDGGWHGGCGCRAQV